jgi:hypothetical protein
VPEICFGVVLDWRMPKPPQKPARIEQALLDGWRIEVIEPKELGWAGALQLARVNRRIGAEGRLKIKPR